MWALYAGAQNHVMLFCPNESHFGVHQQVIVLLVHIISATQLHYRR